MARRERHDDEMTDEEWRVTRLLLSMAEYLGDRISPRKQRLFAVACGRAPWPLLTDPRSRAAVVVAERFADGRADAREVREAEHAAAEVAAAPTRANQAAGRVLIEILHRRAVAEALEELLREHRGCGPEPDAVLDALPGLHAAGETPPLQEAVRAFKDLTESQAAAARAAHAAAWDAEAATRDRFPYLAPATFARQARSARAMPKPPWGHGDVFAVDAAVLDELADLLRCIVGNPFRPVAFDPSWCSPDVRALAGSIDAAGSFDAMPVLADALEEAGCTAAEVLEHCRGARPHARGCWVLDRVLGKV